MKKKKTSKPLSLHLFSLCAFPRPFPLALPSFKMKRRKLIIDTDPGIGTLTPMEKALMRLRERERG